MSINRAFFFDFLRLNLFDGRFTNAQVSGLTNILDAWELQLSAQDDRWLAYMLGTAHHETGRTMQPVRETFASTDKAAASILDSAWRKGKLPWVSTPYWQPDAAGRYWLGRGLVQITHIRNYSRLSKELSIDLVSDPTIAMQPAAAIQIMFRGMIQGSFTSHSLPHYFSPAKADWRNARRIINGVERAELVASYAQRYYAALSYTV